jgi:hypothetical protein
LDTGAERRTITRTVVKLTETEVIYDTGHATDRIGNTVRFEDGRRSTGHQLFGVEYALGKRWTSRARFVSEKGHHLESELALRIVAREKITVTAGVFDAFVVVGEGWSIGSGLRTRLYTRRWLAPDRLRSHLVWESRRQTEGRVLQYREELIAYKQGSPVISRAQRPTGSSGRRRTA